MHMHFVPVPQINQPAAGYYKSGLVVFACADEQSSFHWKHYAPEYHRVETAAALADIVSLKNRYPDEDIHILRYPERTPAICLAATLDYAPKTFDKTPGDWKRYLLLTTSLAQKAVDALDRPYMTNFKRVAFFDHIDHDYNGLDHSCAKCYGLPTNWTEPAWINDVVYEPWRKEHEIQTGWQKWKPRYGGHPDDVLHSPVMLYGLYAM